MGKFLQGYVRFLQRTKLLVLVAWAVVFVGLGWFGARKLMGLTHNAFDPPPGTPSALALDKMNSDFKGFDINATDLVFIQAPDGSKVFDNNLLLSITQATASYLSVRLDSDLFHHLSVSGFYSANASGPAAAAAAFVNPANTSSFLSLQYPKADTQHYGLAFQDLGTHLSQCCSSSAQFVGVGGTAVGVVETIQSATKSIERMDQISLPIAFVVLALSLHSIRLLILPFFTLLIGVVVAFGIMGLLAQAGLSVSSATPPVMMAMLLAVSIDYALFLLTRFKEETEAGVELEPALEKMLASSGHTVVASGSTLAFCFVALLFFPVQLMQSIGAGVIISIVSAIVVNMTFIPAGLLACPRFFSDFSYWGCGCCVRRREATREDAQPLASTPSKPFEETFWFRFALFATSRSALILTLAIVVVAGAAGGVVVSRFSKSMDTMLLSPRDSSNTETTNKLTKSFSPGLTGPYELLLEPSKGGSVYEDQFWTEAGWLIGNVSHLFTGDSKQTGKITSVINSYNLQSQQELSPMALPLAQFLDPTIHDASLCASLPAGDKPACQAFASSKNCADLQSLETPLGQPGLADGCQVFQAEAARTMTQDRGALYASLAPADVPGSQPAVEWSKTCRTYLEGDGAKFTAVNAYLSGVTPEVTDAIDGIYSRLPGILGATMGICLVLVGIMTRSVAFAFGSVLLVAWTMVVVFALGVGVYQDGMFGSHAPAQLANTGGIAWIVPALTFTVILGLGLDYDIFLLGRVCEYRCEGYDDRAAFAYGVAKTGPVITSAGIIMAIAFSGLMLSDIPMLNQFSMLQVVAVLLDTFFIRSLATPAVHTPLGGLNWWPRKVPPISKGATALGSVEVAGLQAYPDA